MFSSIDILSRNKDVYNVWQTGMSNTSLSREEVINKDLKEISKKIIENESDIAFRLSAMVMKGAVVIYSKQATYVLMDCNDVIMRISLKYEANKKDEKKDKKEKNSAQIDDETMAIWEHAENIEQMDVSDDEITQEMPKEETHVDKIEKDEHQQNDDIEEDPQMDLGDAIEFNFSDDDDVEIPQPNDEEDAIVERKKGPEERLELVVDATPLISLNEFMEKYHETEKSFNRARQLKIPKRSIMVIAEELDLLFKEAYEVREEFIKEFPLPTVDDFDIPIAPSEVEEPIEEEIDVDDEDDDSLLSMLPEIQNALRRAKYASLSDITSGLDMQKKASAFYTSLALCSEGKIDIIQDCPNDPIFISSA